MYIANEKYANLSYMSKNKLHLVIIYTAFQVLCSPPFS